MDVSLQLEINFVYTKFGIKLSEGNTPESDYYYFE